MVEKGAEGTRALVVKEKARSKTLGVGTMSPERANQQSLAAQA